MKIQLESTSKIVTVKDEHGNLAKTRVWVGADSEGNTIHAFIVRIATIDQNVEGEQLGLIETERPSIPELDL